MRYPCIEIRRFADGGPDGGEEVVRRICGKGNTYEYSAPPFGGTVGGFCSADLDESGGGFRSEGLLDLFDVGFVVVGHGRKIFFEQEVVPDRAVRVEFVLAVLVGEELLVVHVELLDGGLAAEPAEHVDELAVAVSPLDPARDEHLRALVFDLAVEEVAVAPEVGSYVFAGGPAEGGPELLAEHLGLFGGFGFERDFDEAVVRHGRSLSVVHLDGFVPDGARDRGRRPAVPAAVVAAHAFVLAFAVDLGYPEFADSAVSDSELARQFEVLDFDSVGQPVADGSCDCPGSVVFDDVHHRSSVSWSFLFGSRGLVQPRSAIK